MGGDLASRLRFKRPLLHAEAVMHLYAGDRSPLGRMPVSRCWMTSHTSPPSPAKSWQGAALGDCQEKRLRTIGDQALPSPFVDITALRARAAICRLYHGRRACRSACL